MSLSSARLNQTVIVLVSFFLVPPPDIQIVKVAQRKVSRETPRVGAERGRKILLFPVLFLIYYALSVWKATFFCINWKIISLKRANLHLTFITFYSNKSFNLRVLETKHRNRDGNEKSVGCWIFLKKEQERRIRIPPSRNCYQNLLSKFFHCLLSD